MRAAISGARNWRLPYMQRLPKNHPIHTLTRAQVITGSFGSGNTTAIAPMSHEPEEEL